MRETSVLIVGGGPVGLALAGELGWRGVDCLLVERTDGAITTPKMNEVNLRTMEHCRRWGIAREVVDCPFPKDYPMDVALVTRIGGFEMGRMRRPPKRDQKPGPLSPVNYQICSQLWFDPILRRFAASHRSVTLAHRCRLESFVETADGIEAEILHLADGKRERVRARWLAACDGATSAIRESRGIRLDGHQVLGRPVHFFFRAPRLLADLGVEPATFFLACDRNGLWANLRIIDPASGLWRLMVLDTPPDFDAARIDREAYLQRAVGRDYPVEWVGVSVWTRRGVVAERMKDGRVFLAGDAAHQLSPTGALGMNTGIGDAVDLGWKLAAVTDGWGGPALLDSYDAERRAVGKRNVAMATEFHLDHIGVAPNPIIEDDTAEAAEARAHMGEALGRTAGRMFRTDGLQIGYRYDASPVCVADGTASVPDDSAECVPTTRPGARAPHAWLADGHSILDLFGRGFVLMCFGDAEPATIVAAARQRHVPLRVESVADVAVARLYECRLVLVRPDGHVAWRGDSPPADPLAVIDRVRGA